MARPQTRAPALVDTAPDSGVVDSVSGAELADTPVERVVDMPLLHTSVAHAGVSAERRGDHAAHAALYTLESALGEVRVKVAAARGTLGPDYTELLDRIASIV